MIIRQRFDVDVAGGVVFQDTGQPVNGELMQMRWWHPADTGQVATLQVSVLPVTDDTGVGWLIYNGAATNLATQFVKAPRQFSHDLAGDPDQTDTGTPASPEPIVLAHERLKIRVAPADTGVVLSGGRLYVWSKE
jgi:hypothetical protein